MLKILSIFKLQKIEKNARLGEVQTVHGNFKTPCFMNVATCAAIRGGLSGFDLKQIKTQVALCNTYHLSLRPGDSVVKKLGGLRNFMKFDGPILTDSGGFQVFSLAKINKISNEGVFFNSHIDGRKIFIGPQQSMQIQANLGSTIAMAFDECVKFPSTLAYTQSACERTSRWLEVCLETLENFKNSGQAINREQLLFGINQGLTFASLRKEHMKQITKFNCDGYAIGGLSVGEPKNEMFQIIEEIEPFMPANKPRYLMGVGKPGDIIEAVYRGVDMFDCVMPTRNARHGHLNTWQGILNLMNKKYEVDGKPIDENCSCFVCKTYARAYLRHLLKAGEMLGYRLCILHNLWFYNKLMECIRQAIEEFNFENFRLQFSHVLNERI